MQLQVTQQQLEQAVTLIASNQTRPWEKGYYSRLRAEYLSEHQYKYPLLDYEYKNRRILYQYAHETVVKSGPIDFFEFGVFQGNSFKQWMDINQHPESRFFGFDSFEGLPEAWESCKLEKGHFSTDGALPETDDPRASFVKGFFNKSLRPFLETYEQKNQMVLHIDCDLCSSCLYTLITMDPFIERGTLIVFDDFGVADEFAALHHYTRACSREWKIVAARKDLVKFAIVML